MKKILSFLILVPVVLNFFGCNQAGPKSESSDSSSQKSGIFEALTSLWESAYQNLPDPSGPSDGSTVLRFGDGTLYQAGRTNGVSYMNPAFDLYFTPPEDFFLLDEDLSGEVASLMEFNGPFVMEIAGGSGDGLSSMIIASEEVPPGTTERQWLLDHYSTLFTNRDEDAFRTVKIADLAFTRFEPGPSDLSSYYVRIENGIALSLILGDVAASEDREEAWLAGFSSLSAPSVETDYQKGTLYRDGYESRWLDTRFFLPLFMEWYFSEDLADTETFSCEFEAMSLAYDFYMALYTEVPAFEEERVEDYLGFLLADVKLGHPEGEWSGAFETVRIGNQDYLMAEFTERLDGYLSITRYYACRHHDRFVLLRLEFWDGEQQSAQTVLDSFFPWPATFSSLSEPYSAGTVHNGRYENLWANLAFDPNENALVIPSAKVPSLYLPGRELEGITEYSDCMVFPDFSCLILPEEDPYWISHASLLVYSEQLPASSTLVPDYLEVLPERATEADCNVRYTFDDYTWTAIIGGRYYTTLLSSSRSYNDPVYRKYYVRPEGDRIICLVATYTADNAAYIQSVLNSLYAP